LNISSEQVKAGMLILIAVAETIRELKTAPAGTLYAQLMGKMDLEQFESMIRTLVGTGLVKRHQSHLLEWVGPQVGAKS